MHIQEGFPCFLTTAHSDADLDAVVRAFDQSCREMQAGGVLPAPAGGRPHLDHRSAPDRGATRSLAGRPIEPSASCAFNETFTVTLRGDLNEPALRASLRDVVSRHESLRATFSADGAVARIHPRLELEIPRIDLADAPDPEAELRRILSEEASTPSIW